RGRGDPPHQTRRRFDGAYRRARSPAREGACPMSLHDGNPQMGRENGDGDTLRLFEEELVAHKEWREVGEVVVRTEITEEPDRLEVEATREEIDIEHVPVNQVVETRESPIQEDDAILIPVYEEQLVVQKRLYLREYLRVRRF